MKLIHDATRSNEPVDRLTRLCAAMTAALEAHPEYDDNVKCIVMLSDEETGGMVTLNYDDAPQALVELIAQAQALAQSGGINLDLLTIPDDASELPDE